MALSGLLRVRVGLRRTLRIVVALLRIRIGRGLSLRRVVLLAVGRLLRIGRLLWLAVGAGGGLPALGIMLGRGGKRMARRCVRIAGA